MKYLNSQKYSECQVVSAINASIYFGKETAAIVETGTYEKLVDLAKARYGSALEMGEVLKSLGLTRNGITRDKRNILLALAENKPVGVTIWSPEYGFHNVLIVNYEKEIDCVTALNLSKHTNADCLINWAKFQRMFANTNMKLCFKYSVLRDHRTTETKDANQ